MNERTYHIDSVHMVTGVRTRMTRYPMSHAECCVMLRKFTQHPHRRLELVEVVKYDLDANLDEWMLAA